MLESLRRRASRFGLDVILINVWEGTGAAEEAGRYCQIWGIDDAVLLDETAAYARRLGVRGVPTNVFVDEKGIVRHVGATTPVELLTQAARLVPELRLDGADSGDMPGWAEFVARERGEPSSDSVSGG